MEAHSLASMPTSYSLAPPARVLAGRRGGAPLRRLSWRALGAPVRHDPTESLRQPFHVLSFEGPDAYARAGGIASRIDGLTRALAAAGAETHLWFVGDPDAPGHEGQHGVQLHRWCQWISSHHRGGVYDGEDGKQQDYARSLPPHLLDVLLPGLRAGGRAVVLAEEWHTVHAVLHVDWLLRQAGQRERVTMLWNANNTFGFDRIDWARLAGAAVVTTVSRYMRQCMRRLGVDPIVVPNGVPAGVLAPIDCGEAAELRRTFAGRVALTKMARFDPDKCWLAAIDIVAELKRIGARPLLVARGGIEAHGHEVRARAAAHGLCTVTRDGSAAEPSGLLQALRHVGDADVVELRAHVGPDSRRLLFGGAHAVLANSGHEPFGLVGLEAMGAGGLACTGSSGEDYAAHGRNALVLQRGDAAEFLGLWQWLRNDDASERRMRQAGRRTARDYLWSNVIQRDLLPRIQLLQPA